MTGAGFGGREPLCMHAAPFPRGRSQGHLGGQGKVQEGLDGPHCQAVSSSPQEASSVGAWGSLPRECPWPPAMGTWKKLHHRRHKAMAARWERLRDGRRRTGCTAAKGRASSLCRWQHSWHKPPCMGLGTEVNQAPSLLSWECGRKINFWSLPPKGYALKKVSFYQITVLQNSELNLSKQGSWISQPLIFLNGICC